jgi:peptidoglycan/xylan/chitin deacetylase (PgdA/CDA1 family)
VRPSMTRLLAVATLAITAPAGCSAGVIARRIGPVTSSPASPAAIKPLSKWPIPAFPPAPPPVPIALPPGDAVPFLHAIPTNQRVAFLTIDDGYTKVPDAPALIAAAHVPVTLFLTENAIKDNPAFFAPMQQSGAVIEDHTITHTELRGRSYAHQKREICGAADQLAKWYGRRPVLFRPPFGDQDRTTLRAAHDCGMRAAFMWKATVDKGIVRYQEGRSLKPGDIVLMHFRPAFVEDFLAALNAIYKAGLTPALLDDYLPAA